VATAAYCLMRTDQIEHDAQVVLRLVHGTHSIENTFYREHILYQIEHDAQVVLRLVHGQRLERQQRVFHPLQYVVQLPIFTYLHIYIYINIYTYTYT